MSGPIAPELRAADSALKFYARRVDELQDKLTRAEENLTTMYAEHEQHQAELAKVKREAAAEALTEAADAIPRSMREDEVAMHDLSRVSQLPDSSQFMLNGATRFAERLRARAAEIREQVTG